MIVDREDTGNKNPETEVPGKKMIKNFILIHAVLKAFGQSTLNLHTCQLIKILRQEKEVPITENLRFKNETFEEWAGWKLQYIPPPQAKISSLAGFVNRFISFFSHRNQHAAEVSKN